MKKVFLLAVLCTFAGLSSFSIQQATADCADTSSYGYKKNPTVCAPQKSFTDSSGHKFTKAISYAQRNKIVEGYDDGTFKPNSPINRAEFVKILIEAILGETPAEPSEACFSDVPLGAWYTKYVCFGKDTLFNGYPDGEFKPGNNINISEAAKIIANTFSLSLTAEKPGEPWFGRYIEAVASAKALPTTIQKPGHLVTRAEMVEMIMIINEKLQDHASLTTCDLVQERCEGGNAFSGYGDGELAEYNVDMKKIRQTWLSWYNQKRSEAGLHDYTYNNQLNRSAFIWSDFSMDRGELSHKRIGQTAYYDYNLITSWFADLDLTFENVNQVTHSENIGFGPFNCSDNDCTDEMISAIQDTFDFYMSEKDQDYRPHYNSVMNQYFNEIGLGIVTDGNQYYLTVHYGTNLL